MQCAQRLAAIGISLRHSGQGRVVGDSVGPPAARRAASMFSGFTTKKKIAAAMLRNAMTAFRKSP